MLLIERELKKVFSPAEAKELRASMTDPPYPASS